MHASSTIRTTGALVIVALVALAPAGLAAAPLEDFRVQQVVRLLEMPDHEPTLEDWKRVGPDANRILVQLIQNPDLRPSTRTKAIASLAWFPSRRSRAVLGRIVHDTKAPLPDRRVAIEALAKAYGVAVFEDVKPLLLATEPFVREGAIRGLAAMRGRRARALLEAHVPREQDVRLRLLTEQLLQKLDEASRRRPTKRPVPPVR